MSDMAMPTEACKPLDTYKRDAARLLKAARLRDPAALMRFQRLDQVPAELRLKHALAVISKEAGFEAWTALKQSLEGLDFTEFFAAPSLKDSINHWFRNYEEAKAHHLEHGGVLLPYHAQAFVSSFEILPRMGYLIDDPDWREIAYDFINPASQAAHHRIQARLTRRFSKA